MRCGGALLLVSLLFAVRAQGALSVEDEYEKALRDEARGTACEDCPRCPPPPARCSFLLSSGGNYFYNVDGVKLQINFWSSSSTLTLTCPPTVSLESASLPVFPTLKHVTNVGLTACPAPRAAGGISRALSRLNITAGLDLDILNLDDVPAPRLQPDLFAGLQNVLSLSLSAETGLVLEPPPGLLEPLKNLSVLRLTDVRMSPAMLELLPPNLQFLSVVQRRPAEELAPAPRSMDPENVTLTAARGSCPALRQLSVATARGAVALPAGWLQARGEARCPRLRDLRLHSCALGGLPADALRRLTKLRDLTVTDCRELRALPHGLFNDTRDLRGLFLQNNSLEVLPEGIFEPLRKLEELDLSGNRLGMLGDGAAALGGVRALTSLQILKLDHNPLGDTCGPTISPDAFRLTTNDNELSPLRELRALRRLSLAHTGASWPCKDWRRDLKALYTVNLSYNNVTVLKYSDMLWYGRVCKVDLRGNPLRDVIMTSEDYAAASDVVPIKGSGVLYFDADLVSSCRVYWVARALREGRLRAKLVNLTCAGRPLAVAPLEAMTCAESDACPARCACTLRPSVDTLELRCARRDLPDLGPAAALARRLELRLAGARLASLPDALPERLRVLDLRNASLPAATERQAAALFADERVVLLGGARVACACAGGARPALARALGARLRGVRCAEDGRRVQEAPRCAERERERRGAWAAALGGLAAATLVLSGAWCAARRGSRLRVKAFLLARGLCPAWTRRDDDDVDCTYDVFIWFSRHDFAVVSQIVRELESGQRPLRVCVHYRDWYAGESILAQIQRSVVRSRRTLVLVSRHAAASLWARAALREAAARALRDVTPRLVVALLQPAPPPGLDAELAHYVRAHTYARWGDAAFWDRLRLALPPGRPRATAAVPPHAVSAEPPRATAAVTPRATAAVPPHAVSAEPPRATAAVPPRATAAVPPHAVSAEPPRATAAVPPRATAAVPPHAVSAEPPRATAAVPPRATAAVPPHAVSAEPPRATAAVPPRATAAVPPHAVSAEPPRATAAVPPRATAAVPPHAVSAEPPRATAAVPPRATAAVPPHAVSAEPPRATAAVPPRAAVAVPPHAVSAEPPRATAAVPPRATAAVPPHAVSAEPPRATAAVPPRATAAVPPHAVSAEPPRATAAVPPRATAAVPPHAVSAEPPRATAAVPPRAAVAVPPHAVSAEPPRATAAVPPRATAAVPPLATAAVPPNAVSAEPPRATAAVPLRATVAVPPHAVSAVPPRATAAVQAL